MALYKRSGTWWVDIAHCGKRVRRSTGSIVKKDAQLFHDKLKAELWRHEHNEKQLPQKTWMNAVVRWLNEATHKRSLITDKYHLQFVDQFLRRNLLEDISNDDIEAVAKAKEDTGVSPATVNRMLEIVRAILRKAKHDWDWLSDVPKVRMRKINNRRIRWLTLDEAERLLHELPKHLAAMAQFTLLTGLRESNVTGLQWQDVDLARRHALIHPDQSKTKKAIPIPLNDEAIALLQKQQGKHPTHVFTYFDKPVLRCSVKRLSVLRSKISAGMI